MSKHVSLVFYIGNGSVKGAVVSNEKNKPPHILSARVRELSYQEYSDREHLEFRVMKEFSNLLNDIKFQDLTSPACKGVRVKDASVILSSPWYVSETKIIKIEGEKPFTVTERAIEDALKSAASGYIEKDKNGIVMLERNVVRYSLNGYITASPFRKSAQHVEIATFFSFCKKQTIDSIREAVLSQFGIHNTGIYSQSLAAFTAVKETWKSITNYVLTDISSQLTELMIVRQNTLAEAASFPMGKQFIVQELAKQLSMSGEVSQSILSMYNSNTIEPDLKIKVTTALDEIRKTWLQPFTKALTEMSAGTSLPSRFILFASKDTGALFSQFIKSEEYQQFTFSEGKFEVYEAVASDFAHSYTVAENVVQDISLAVGTIFLHKKFEGVI